MTSSSALQQQLADVEAELAGMDERRAALEQAAEDLRAAIASVEALEATSPGTGPAPGRRSAQATPRPTVTSDDLVAALEELGGTATVEQLVEELSLPDGRSLNGARRVAVDEGRVRYEERTYSLT